MSKETIDDIDEILTQAENKYLNEKDNAPEFRKITDLNEEAKVLHDAQANQALWMEHSGVADEARRIKVGEYENGESPDFPMLAEGHDDSRMYLVRKRSSSGTDTVTIRFAKPIPGTKSASEIQDLTVGEIERGNDEYREIHAKDGFSELQVQRMDDMLDMLDEQRGTYLPDLAKDLGHIKTPEHAQNVRRTLGDVMLEHHKRAE
jgi:hypothetical protein